MQLKEVKTPEDLECFLSELFGMEIPGITFSDPIQHKLQLEDIYTDAPWEMYPDLAVAIATVRTKLPQSNLDLLIGINNWLTPPYKPPEIIINFAAYQSLSAEANKHPSLRQSDNEKNIFFGLEKQFEYIRPYTIENYVQNASESPADLKQRFDEDWGDIFDTSRPPPYGTVGASFIDDLESDNYSRQPNLSNFKLLLVNLEKNIRFNPAQNKYFARQPKGVEPSTVPVLTQGV